VGTSKCPTGDFGDRYSPFEQSISSTATSIFYFTIPISGHLIQYLYREANQQIFDYVGLKIRRFLPWRRPIHVCSSLSVRLVSGLTYYFPRISWIPYTDDKGDITSCGVPQTYDASKEFADKKVVLFAVPGQSTFPIS